MGLFLLYPLLLTLMTMLLAAAMTFAVTAEAPALRRFAITAPVAAFFVTPAALFSMSPWILRRFFVTEPPFGSAGFWARFGIGAIFCAAGCLFLAWLATFFLRIAIELASALLSRNFGLGPALPVQTILVGGATLSAIVFFVSFGLLMIYKHNNDVWMTTLAIIGIGCIWICFRAIFRVDQPESYRPKALPDKIRKLITMSEGRAE